MVKGFLKGAMGAVKAFNQSVKAKGGYRQMAKAFGNALKPGGAMSAFESIEGGVRYNIHRDMGVKLLAATPKTMSKGGSAIGAGAKFVGRKMAAVGRPIAAAARTPVGKAGTRGMFAVGALGMLGIHTMKGGMNEAKDIAHERYMQDYTYSKSMLQNSRVGLASGTSRMLNRGGHQGLTTAMHKTRHGR